MVISGLGKCGSGCRCKRMERTKVGRTDGHKRGEVSGGDERGKGSLMRWIFGSFQRGLVLVQSHALFGGVVVSRWPKGTQKFTLSHWTRHMVSTVCPNQWMRSVHWFRYTVGSIVVVKYVYIFCTLSLYRYIMHIYINLSVFTHAVMLVQADAEGMVTCL